MSVYFSNGNTLLPSNDSYIVRIFNIPAISIRDAQGNINKNSPTICIEAPEICKEICYAYKRQKGGEIIVYGRRKKNYDATQCDDFVDQVKNKISGTIRFYEKKGDKRPIIYRIHESGDFYSVEYLQKWVTIANHFKDQKNVHFMAYTKNIEILNQFLQNNTSNVKGLKDINIKFMYSVMLVNEHSGKHFKNTLDQPKKLEIANDLRKQGLRYYYLCSKDDKLPSELESEEICELHQGRTCSDCGMRCYLDNVDIVAVER